METDPYHSQLIFQTLAVTFNALSPASLTGLASLVMLLLCSALISGSEVAFFALSPSDIENLRQKQKSSSDLVLKLLEVPEKLLATILIVNNFINVAIVIIASYIMSETLDFGDSYVLGFIVQVVVVTFLLLLFGEVLPKVYATQSPRTFSIRMAGAMRILIRIFSPISRILIFSTSHVNRHFAQKGENISMSDLSHALELTSSSIAEDKNILKGIIKFGDIDVKEIMKSRVDVVAVDINTQMNKLISIIIESGYSRIPVFEESFDNIKGILYIKDLLPHLHEDNSFQWQPLIRPPYFVPESKKINDLLTEFQTNKIHMAIVIDEYGGTSGIVTLEDILEEIVGEIADESDDEDEIVYTKLNDKTYLFEGKILLNDFYKLTHSNDDVFDDVKGDADTLAGLILEIKGEIPAKNSKITYKNFTFTIESADKRRIKQIKVHIEDEKDEDSKNSKAE